MTNMREAAHIFKLSNQLLQPDVHMHGCAEVGSLLQSHFLVSGVLKWQK